MWTLNLYIKIEILDKALIFKNAHPFHVTLYPYLE